MSSPLNWIRKHQRYLMGVFGVLLILSFTVSLGTGYDPLVDFISGGARSSSRDPVVVTSDWGKLRESDLNNLRIQRTLVAQFQYAIRERAASRGAEYRGESPLPQDNSEMELLVLYASANEARKAGMVVTNQEIVDYLTALTDARLEEHEFDEIWKAVGNRKYSQRQLMEMLRTELLGHRYRELVNVGLEPISPVQDWELFNRMERRLTIETFAVDVDAFTEKVGKPTESELKQLFETHRHEFPDNVDGRPGFKVPRKRAFRYVKFNFSPLLEAEKAKVADEQIADYYEKNKEQFVETNLPTSDLQLGSEGQGTEGDPGAGGTEETPTSENGPQVDEPSTTAAPAEPTESGEPATPAESAEGTDTATPPADQEGVPTGEEPAQESAPANGENSQTETADDATNAQEPAEGETTPPSDPPSPAPSPSPVPQETPETTETTETTETPAASEGEPAADPAASELAKDALDEEVGVGEPPATDPSETPTEEPPATEPAATEPPAEGAGGVATVPAPAASTPDPSRYKPLDAVRDEIRDTIAFPIAQGKLKAIMLSVSTELAKYHLQMNSWEQKRRPDESVEKPRDPDLSKIASEIPLKVEDIPLTDANAIRSHEIGQTFDIVIQGQGFYYEFFHDLGFREQIPLYQARTFPTYEDERDRYIFWITENMEPKVPTFEEAREAVIAAWTKDQALQLATQAAQAEADKAKKSGESLEKCCLQEGRVFIPATDVHWMVSRSLATSQGMRPALGRIEGVDGVTDSMMRAIFRLNPGDVGVVPNGPKSKVYVVRVESEGPELAVREEIFFREGARTTDMMWLEQIEREERLYRWFTQLRNKNNVVWLREPRPSSRM
jgi:hypothetical protein